MRTLVLLLLIAGYICSAEILVNNIRASSTGSSSGSTSRITTKPATTTQKPLPTTTKPATTTPKPLPTTPKSSPTTTPKPSPTTTKPATTTQKPLPTTPKSSPRTTPKPSPTTSRILSTTPRPSLTTTKFSPTSPKLSSTSQSPKTSVKPSPTATSRTPAPKIIDCYYCGDPGYPCPQPFNSYDRNVRITPTSGRFCVKLGPDNGGRGPFYRKPASSSECSQRGCSRKYINFQWTEVCCCDRNKCNMGIASAKSTWGLIFSTLAVIFIYHQF